MERSIRLFWAGVAGLVTGVALSSLMAVSRDAVALGLMVLACGVVLGVLLERSAVSMRASRRFDRISDEWRAKMQ